MTQTVYPETIRAQLDPSLLERIPRMYPGTTADAFAELLQNARRAGADRVDVTFDTEQTDPDAWDGQTPVRVTVQDNGCGIADPRVVLAYGLNGWNRETVHREDAAGMGFMALAALGCTVTSWTKGAGAAWSARLDPRHFQGQTEATLETLPAPEDQSGTRVTFHVRAAANHVLADLENQALYYPLPVTLHLTDSPSIALCQRAFLDDQAPGGAYRGVRYAHMERPFPAPDRTPHDLNFHGLTLNAKLPQLTDAWGCDYTVCADVDNASDLQLVLPARKEIVETDVVRALRAHLRRFLLETISNDEKGDLTFAQYQEAGRFMNPAPARPRLCRWQPWRPRETYYVTRPDPRPLTPAAVRYEVADGDDPAPVHHAIARAVEGCGLDLCQSHDGLSGYDWYQSLPAVVACDWEIELDGAVYDLSTYPVPDTDSGLPERPDRITCVLTLENPGGGTERRRFDTDLVIHAAEAYASHLYYGNVPIVTKDSTLTHHELADLLVDVFFYFDEDLESDSLETQEAEFRNDAYALAVHLLKGREEGQRQAILARVYDHLWYLRPKDARCVVVRLYPDTARVDFETDDRQTGADPEEPPA